MLLMDDVQYWLVICDGNASPYVKEIFDILGELLFDLLKLLVFFGVN